MIPEDLDILLLCHEFSGSQMQDAYEPFLIWIRNVYFSFYQHMTPEKFIEAGNIYPLQRSLFSSYLKEKQCNREEELMLCEMDYECSRMNQSILAMLKYIAEDHPIICVLNNAHCAPKSTIDLLMTMVNSTPAGNLGFIICFNEVSQIMPYVKEAWKTLVKQVEKNLHLIDWGTTERQKTVAPTVQFTPQPLAFQSYIAMIHNMVHTLAIEQANYYLAILYHKLEVERAFVVRELKEQILYLYSLTTIYLGDYSKALLLLG